MCGGPIEYFQYLFLSVWGPYRIFPIFVVSSKSEDCNLTVAEVLPSLIAEVLPSLVAEVLPSLVAEVLPSLVAYTMQRCLHLWFKFIKICSQMSKFSHNPLSCSLVHVNY